MFTRILTLDREEIESLPQTLIIIPYINLQPNVVFQIMNFLYQIIQVKNIKKFTPSGCKDINLHLSL